MDNEELTHPVDIEVPLPNEVPAEQTQSWAEFNGDTAVAEESKVDNDCVGCPDPAQPFFEQKAEVDAIVEEANTQEVEEPEEETTQEVMPGITVGGQGNPTFGPEEIEKRFGFHKATIDGPNATLPRHKDLRMAFREFAEYLDGVLPEGREKSVAFTELENASMWSHKSIAQAAPIEGEQ